MHIDFVFASIFWNGFQIHMNEIAVVFYVFLLVYVVLYAHYIHNRLESKISASRSVVFFLLFFDKEFY